MFTDENAILQAAAALAVAHRAGTSPADVDPSESMVDVLINILRQMESKQLIPAGTAPPDEASTRKRPLLAKS